jgi:hypothetical protein
MMIKMTTQVLCLRTNFVEQRTAGSTRGNIILIIAREFVVRFAHAIALRLSLATYPD